VFINNYFDANEPTIARINRKSQIKNYNDILIPARLL